MEKVGNETTNKSKSTKKIRLSNESLNVIDIHVFGDASLLGTCAVAYAVIQQPFGIKQGLIASKSRLSKKQITIPRLESVAAQMETNLAKSMRTSLPNHNGHISPWMVRQHSCPTLAARQWKLQAVSSQQSITHKLEVKNQLEICSYYPQSCRSW